MEPTPKQLEAIEIGLNSTQPVAWLGGVRSGKSVGSAFMLLEAMRERPGDYVAMAFSRANISNVLWPNIIQILDAWGEDYVQRKAPPKHIEWEHGKIMFFVASDRSAEKALQGVTIQGAYTDEIILFPKNVVMQLVGRFSKDRPFWIMTANKSDPFHWIKTEWIDAGVVTVIEADIGDNPHMSDEARGWQNSLLTGHFKDRMLHNDWRSDMNQICKPWLLKRTHKPGRRDRRWQSLWLDEGRHHALVSGRLVERGLLVEECMTASAIGDLEAPLADPCQCVGNWLGDLAKQPKGRLVCWFPPDPERYARSLSRVQDSVMMIPRTRDLHSQVSNWAYRSQSEHDLSAGLSTTTSEVLAVAQAAHHLLRSGKAFTAGKR